MRARLATLVAGGAILVAAVVMTAGFLALRGRAERDTLRAWVLTEAAHPGWAEALASGQPNWQISRPTPNSILVEYLVGSGSASLYTAAIRERDAAAAAMSHQVFLMAQLQAIGADAAAGQADFPVGDAGSLFVHGTQMVAVARRGNAVVVINASDLPVPPHEDLRRLVEEHLERIRR